MAAGETEGREARRAGGRYPQETARSLKRLWRSRARLFLSFRPPSMLGLPLVFHSVRSRTFRSVFGDCDIMGIVVSEIACGEHLSKAY